jgi:hypothetical protein
MPSPVPWPRALHGRPATSGHAGLARLAPASLFFSLIPSSPPPGKPTWAGPETPHPHGPELPAFFFHLKILLKLDKNQRSSNVNI